MRQLRALIVVATLAAAASLAIPTSASAAGYTVRWGDTLSGISTYWTSASEGSSQSSHATPSTSEATSAGGRHIVSSAKKRE